MTAKLKVHPFAATYPPMSEDELVALTEDIKARGLQRPIVRYEGMILDGRNRYLACERAGVEPTFTDYEGDDPLGQVNSLNLSRDLTGAQRAIVAARQWGLEGYSKGGRPGSEKLSSLNTVSVRSLSRQFRVSTRDIGQARDLLAEAPDLAAQVEACHLSLAAATQQLDQRRKEAAQKTKDAQRVKEYRDAISSGEMSLEAAIQKAMEREREERETLASQADARRNWLKELARVVEWVERFVGTSADDYLAWYGQPEAPGSFDHGLTARRLDGAAAQLGRISAITFGGNHHESGRADGPELLEGGGKKGKRAAG
jgi:hypothetical protein